MRCRVLDIALVVAVEVGLHHTVIDLPVLVGLSEVLLRVLPGRDEVHGPAVEPLICLLQLGVQKRQIPLILDSLTVWRVREDITELTAVREIRDVTHLQMHDLLYTGTLCVLSRDRNHLRIDVIALDIHLLPEAVHTGLEQRLVDGLIRLVECVIPALLIDQIRPRLGNKGTIHAWGDVGSDHGCLDHEGTGAAHRIDEGVVLTPAGLHDEGRSQRLGDRREPLLQTVATLMEGLTGGIEADREDILIRKDTYRILRTMLLEPVDAIVCAHAGNHGLLHNRLDVTGRKELRLDGARLRNPEAAILRYEILPWE